MLALDTLPDCIGGESMTPIDIDLLVGGLLTASISSPRLPLYDAALVAPGRAEAGRVASWLGARLSTLLRVLEVRWNLNRFDLVSIAGRARLGVDETEAGRLILLFLDVLPRRTKRFTRWRREEARSSVLLGAVEGA